MDQKLTRMRENSASPNCALQGLRGLASLHVLIFHCFLYSPFKLMTMGSLQMPLFFLLSGFSLALAYSEPVHSSNKKLTSSWDFYRNRFARVGPVYYLSNALAFPLAYMGFTPVTLLGTSFTPTLWSVSLNTICFTNVWFLFLLGAGFSFPSWTVGTLLFFYLCFPHIFPRIQHCSDHQLSRWIVILFYVQLSFIIVTISLDMFVSNAAIKFIFGYWFVTAHPISRLPVFLMGVLAGIQQNRLNTSSSFEDENNDKSWICDILPNTWGTSINEYRNTNKHEDTEKYWKKRVDRNVIILIALVFIFTTIHGITGWIHNEAFHNHQSRSTSNNSFIENEEEMDRNIWFENGWGRGNFYLQLFAVHMQLVVITGLNRDGGQSITARFCSWRPIQELGRISMSLYLIHEVLIHWVRLMVHGSFQWVVPGPNGWLDLKEMGFPYEADQMPFWGIPLILIVAPVMAWIITVYIEEPLRTILRKRKRKVSPMIMEHPNNQDKSLIPEEVDMDIKHQTTRDFDQTNQLCQYYKQIFWPERDAR